MGMLRALYYIFECTLLVAAGPSLMGARMTTKTILMLGVLQGLLLTATRTIYQFYKIPLGTHTIILAITLFLLLWQVAKLPWFTSICGMLISFTLLIVGENFVLMPLATYFQINFNLILSNIFWFYLAGLSSDTFLILVIIFNWFRNRNA